MRKHPSMMLVLILVATIGLSACAEKKPEPLPPPPANLRTTQLRSLPQRLRLRPEVPHTSFPRHSATSLLLNSGVDPFAVQKLAGHSDVRLTTQTYAHVQTEALRRAAGVLDRVGPQVPPRFSWRQRAIVPWAPDPNFPENRRCGAAVPSPWQHFRPGGG